MQLGKERCKGRIVPGLRTQLAEQRRLHVAEDVAELVVSIGIEVGGSDIGGVEDVVGIELQ